MKKFNRIADLRQRTSLAEGTRNTTHLGHLINPPVTLDQPEQVMTRLAESFTGDQIDKAIDKAARLAEAVVAQFSAAPSEVGHGGTAHAHVINRMSVIPTAGVPAMEIAIEFFVPPASLDVFRHELEGQLQRFSPSYSAARCRGDLGPVIVRSVPTGAFHQWRLIWGMSTDTQHRRRWSATREMLDSVLAQARDGWREVAI